ncbi:MAG: ABC transporter substrate-binding protein [Xanthobacteraceae bacterium]|jgi:branched-chain amino acid transport system substrate-binding protein
MKPARSFGFSAVLGLLCAAPAFAQDTIKIPNIIELSGAGATVGANWKNGSSLAVDEINAAGGLLRKKVVLEFVDTATDPGKARAAIQRALDDKPIAIFGPIYSGSVNATLKLTAEAEVPQVIGGEAANLTAQGSKYIFRTSFGQNVSMPKIANYLRDQAKAKTLAIVYVNNDFGKGGRNAIMKELEPRGIKVVADLSTEAGQADFAADVLKLKSANADAVFVYLNEEESARFLIEAKKQGLNKPLIGETTLLGQKVIDLAKDAANGVKGHVGLTVDAPIPAIQEFGRKYEAKFNYKPDHNGVKGYIAPYMIKAAAEKAGKLDPKAIAAALRGLTITPDKLPGILIEATWDDTGEIDRISFLAEVKDGKQVITQTLPKLNK